MLSDEGERGQRCQMWGNSEHGLSKASPKELSTSKLVHSSALGKATHWDPGKEPQQGRVETGARWQRLSLSVNVLSKDFKEKRCEVTLSQTLHYPCGLPPSKHFPRVGLRLPHRWAQWPWLEAAPGEKKATQALDVCWFLRMGGWPYSLFSGWELNMRHRADELINNIAQLEAEAAPLASWRAGPASASLTGCSGSPACLTGCSGSPACLTYLLIF